MGPLLERLPSGSRIAVIRLRSLGDCVLTTPALALLKENRPDLRVAVVVEDRFRALFEDIRMCEGILAPDVAAIARWSPRLVLNLHGGTRSMALTIASRARFRAGFAHHRFSFLYFGEDSASPGDSRGGAAGPHRGTYRIGDVLAGRAEAEPFHAPSSPPVRRRRFLLAVTR